MYKELFTVENIQTATHDFFRKKDKETEWAIDVKISVAAICDFAIRAIHFKHQMLENFLQEDQKYNLPHTVEKLFFENFLIELTQQTPSDIFCNSNKGHVYSKQDLMELCEFLRSKINIIS